MPNGKILVVDDEPGVREVIQAYLDGEGYDCRMAADGELALKELRHHAYDLLISDINMPGLTGDQLFRQVRREFPDLAVVMLTGMVDLDTAVEMMKGGLYDYITKPVELDQLGLRIEAALEQRSLRRQEASIVEQLKQRLSETGFALEYAQQSVVLQQQGTLEMLVRALDARERETQQHSFRVQAYALRLARKFPFSEQQRRDLARGALLHDIGKIGVPDSVLLKPGQLDPEEWAQMRRHPKIGYDIVYGIDFLREAADVVLNHHENFDGSGYPSGLRGPQIPLTARIFSLIDAFDALTTNRPYRQRTSVESARRYLASRAGSQFDPEVVEKFLQVPIEEWRLIRDRFS